MGPALKSACSNSTDLVRQASIEASTGPAGVEQEEAPQENGRQPRRPKKRSGRRKKERQPHSSFVAVKDQEANGPAPNGPAINDPVPTAAFGEGFGTHNSTQAWAEGTARSPFVLCLNRKPLLMIFPEATAPADGLALKDPAPSTALGNGLASNNSTQT